jgi:hypothetical protein
MGSCEAAAAAGNDVSGRYGDRLQGVGDMLYCGCYHLTLKMAHVSCVCSVSTQFV